METFIIGIVYAMTGIQCCHRLTASLSTASLGWKLFGPSSYWKPSSVRLLMMLPPTRSCVSVIRKVLTVCECSEAKAWAKVNPDMPAPTMTQSKVCSSDSCAALGGREAVLVVAVDANTANDCVCRRSCFGAALCSLCKLAALPACR